MLILLWILSLYLLGAGITFLNELNTRIKDVITGREIVVNIKDVVFYAIIFPVIVGIIIWSIKQKYKQIK